MLAEGEVVSSDLRNLAQFPLTSVFEYKRMWAYGNHFRAEDITIGNTHEGYDSGVAAIVSTECQASTADRRLVQANLKYVGVLRNIIQVNYVSLKVNVMECSWIRPNVTGNATMKTDEHGFSLVKRDAFQGPRAEKYILPAHASQVTIHIYLVLLVNHKHICIILGLRMRIDVFNSCSPITYR